MSLCNVLAELVDDGLGKVQSDLGLIGAAEDVKTRVGMGELGEGERKAGRKRGQQHLEG